MKRMFPTRLPDVCARAEVTLVVVLGGLAGAGPGAAQDPCPSASGADAEAGWTAYVADDMAEARARFRAALARCGNDEYARTGLAYVELREGIVAEAERLWETVLVTEPNNVDALVGIGLARWRSGDIDAVLARFTRVLELSPGHPTALEYLARVSAATAPEQPVDEDRADQAFREGELGLALRLYQDRLAYDSGDLAAMLRIGQLFAWEGRYTESIAMLDRLVGLEPRHVDGRLARARARAWSGDLAAAQREVRQLLAVQPDDPEALEALAQLRAWSGRADEALAIYDDLVAIAPSSAAIHRQEAQALAWADDLEASRAAYEALLARDPNDVEARLGLARALGWSGDLRGALAEYDRVLDRDPMETRARAGQARTLGWAGRLVDAEQAAAAAVDADPANGGAWAVLGQVYRWQGRNADAKEALETAARLAPSDPEVRDQLRIVEIALSPAALQTISFDEDSDGNRMATAEVTAGWHPASRLELRADGYWKELDYGALRRSAQGVMLGAAYQLRPGWTVTAGVGGSRSDGPSSPSGVDARASVRTPGRHALGATLAVSTMALHETASLAELGARSTEALFEARWTPGPRWRVDGSVGVGAYDASVRNTRRSASLSASRRLGEPFSLGVSLRGFSFEDDLDDGYFDPDFYGVAELTGYWLHRPGHWTLLLELAPGVQQVAKDGDPRASMRGNARVGYRIGQGREVFATFRYSSAGLVTFATGADGYRYTGLAFGTNWVF